MTPAKIEIKVVLNCVFVTFLFLMVVLSLIDHSFFSVAFIVILLCLLPPVKNFIYSKTNKGIIYLLLNWILGPCIFLTGLGILINSFFSKEFLVESFFSGVFLIVISLFLLPPVKKFAYSKTNKKISVRIKKLLEITLITIISIIVLFNVASYFKGNWTNKFRDGFYFEKYKTADKAKEALLGLHPIGSNAKSLINTIEKAGAFHKPITNLKYKDRPEYKNYLSYTYNKKMLFGLANDKYGIGIKYDENHKIKNIKVLFYGIK